MKLRYYYYRRRLGYCGKNVRIDIGVVFQSPKCIFLDDNVWIDKYVCLIAGKPQNDLRPTKVIKNINYLHNKGEIHIKSNVHICPYCLIQGHGGVFIGLNAGIASGTKVYSYSHHYKNLITQDKKIYYLTSLVENNKQFMIEGPIVLDKGVAIGLNSTILPGVFVPENSWFGTSSTITNKSYKPNSVYTQKSDFFEKTK